MSKRSWEEKGKWKTNEGKLNIYYTSANTCLKIPMLMMTPTKENQLILPRLLRLRLYQRRVKK